MSTPPGVAVSPHDCILAFDGNNRLAVRRLGSGAALPFTGADLGGAIGRLESSFRSHSRPVERFTADAGGHPYRVFFAQVEGPPSDPEIEMRTAEQLESDRGALAPSLAGILAPLEPHLIEIPYLNLGENDFIYKFRPERERNTAVYVQDPEAGAIYQLSLIHI